MAGRPKPLNPGSSGLAVFGSMLRMHRESAGYTISDLSPKINNSVSTISDTEHGKSRCDRSLAENADRELNTGGSLAHLWDLLVKGAVYPRWFDWPIYEARSTTLRSFQGSVIDGLLQAESYALAVLHGNEAAVEARMGRQTILSREEPPPPFVVCLLNEVVLQHQIGSPQVMHDQLMHLVASVSDRICIQVVPNGVARPEVTGAFVLATLEDRSEIAYIETAARGISTGDKQDITTLRSRNGITHLFRHFCTALTCSDAPDSAFVVQLRLLSESFDRIRSQALPVDMSMDLIRRTAEEKWT